MSFNIKIIENRIRELDDVTMKYVMATDMCNGNTQAYTLVRIIDNNFEIILCKTMHDEGEFKKEVDNLVKYFNASYLVDETLFP